MTIDEPRSVRTRDCHHDWNTRDYEVDIEQSDAAEFSPIIRVDNYCPNCDTLDKATLTPRPEVAKEFSELKSQENDPENNIEHVGLYVDENPRDPYEFTAYVHIDYEDESGETRNVDYEFTPR